MSDIILKEDKGIVYEILQEKDLEKTAALISEVFSKGEPMTKSLGITAKEFHYFAEIYCKKAVRDGSSIIAKDKGYRKISILPNQRELKKSMLKSFLGWH